MKKLEKILEEIEQYISEWEADPKDGYASGFIKGLKKSEKIIRKYLSRENTPKITRSSRDSQCGECSQGDMYIKAFEDVLKEDGVSKEFLEDCRRTAQKYKKDNDGWISVEERLPTMREYQKDDGRFILDDGIRRCAGYFNVYTGRFYSYQHITQYMAELHENNWVIAWRPLPEPYRPERRSDEKE